MYYDIVTECVIMLFSSLQLMTSAGVHVEPLPRREVSGCVNVFANTQQVCHGDGDYCINPDNGSVTTAGCDLTSCS